MFLSHTVGMHTAWRSFSGYRPAADTHLALKALCCKSHHSKQSIPVSHLCIAVLRWRLAGVCRRRWGSGWSRAAGRWCTQSPQRGVRWADGGCRWIRWRWAWRCWARRRWWCWLVENWGLLENKTKQKKQVRCYWIARTLHSTWYCKKKQRKKTCR